MENGKAFSLVWNIRGTLLPEHLLCTQHCERGAASPLHTEGQARALVEGFSGRWAALPPGTETVLGPCRLSVSSSLQSCTVEIIKDPKLGLFDTLGGRRGWGSTLGSPASLEESKGCRAEGDCARITPAGEKRGSGELTGARQYPPQGFMGRRLVWPTPTPAKGKEMKENSNEVMSE